MNGKCVVMYLLVCWFKYSPDKFQAYDMMGMGMISINSRQVKQKADGLSCQYN